MMVGKRPRRSAEDFAKRFGWEADDITVTGPGGEIVDISKKPEEKEPTGKDIVRQPQEEK
ncbi:MAG: hypothetical protein IIA72_00670 [Proteobacteria bacterium]|nr:hypothetical protein [Pseudomonadota bacterium]